MKAVQELAGENATLTGQVEELAKTSDVQEALIQEMVSRIEKLEAHQ